MYIRLELMISITIYLLLYKKKMMNSTCLTIYFEPHAPSNKESNESNESNEIIINDDIIIDIVIYL